MTAPLAWLIDTNVVSEMMRPCPDPSVAAFLDSVANEGLGLASITVWEVLDGIGRLAAAAASRGLAVVTRNTGVTTVNPWTAGPR